MAASTPNPPPEPPTEEPVDATPTGSTFRRWVRELSRGGKWLLGVIIVALVGALVPVVVKGCGGPDELGADLSGVRIDRNVTLDEYALRHARASTSTPSRATVVRLAAHLVAQTPSDGTTTDGTTPDGTTPDGTTTDGTTTDGTTTDGTTTDGTTTDGTTTDGTTTDDAGIVRRPQLSAQVRERLNEGVDRAVGELQMKLGRACEEDAGDRACPLPPLITIPFIKTQGDEGPVEGAREGLVSAETVARQLEKIFIGTRKRDGQMVGVTVNFRISMTGFDDGTADIRWSLYSAKSDVPVPRDWLRLRPALSLRAEAPQDSGSDEFWVPIPNVKGPFFVRLGVYDEDDQRLDYADTARFR